MIWRRIAEASCGLFSVQMDSAGLPSKQGGMDHRYHWAQWDGERWISREIARAGRRLYAGEDDYTGGICLHPDEPGTVFISSSVEPRTGEPLASGHYELFKGRRNAKSGDWTWESLTPGATEDQQAAADRAQVEAGPNDPALVAGHLPRVHRLRSSGDGASGVGRT